MVGPLAGGKLADANLVSWFDYATSFWVVALLLAIVALVGLRFRETSGRPADQEVRFTQALHNLLRVFQPGTVRQLYLANFVLYLSIFGFFRVYPMYLVERFTWASPVSRCLWPGWPCSSWPPTWGS